MDYEIQDRCFEKLKIARIVDVVHDIIWIGVMFPYWRYDEDMF
jgi:hypothetical protein